MAPPSSPLPVLPLNLLLEDIASVVTGAGGRGRELDVGVVLLVELCRPAAPAVIKGVAAALRAGGGLLASPPANEEEGGDAGEGEHDDDDGHGDGGGGDTTAGAGAAVVVIIVVVVAAAGRIPGHHVRGLDRDGGARPVGDVAGRGGVEDEADGHVLVVHIVVELVLGGRPDVVALAEPGAVVGVERLEDGAVVVDDGVAAPADVEELDAEVGAEVAAEGVAVPGDCEVIVSECVLLSRGWLQGLRTVVGGVDVEVGVVARLAEGVDVEIGSLETDGQVAAAVVRVCGPGRRGIVHRGGVGGPGLVDEGVDGAGQGVRLCLNSSCGAIDSRRDSRVGGGMALAIERDPRSAGSHQLARLQRRGRGQRQDCAKEHGLEGWRDHGDGFLR